jgi:transketolase
MRVQPSLTVVAPADAAQTQTVMSTTWDLPGPVYIRLGKDDRPRVPGLEGRFRLGRAETVRDGSEVLLVAMGGIAAQAVSAADDLARRDVLCTVMIVASLNPAPVDDIAEAAVRHRLVVTVESHYVVGGLGSLVAEIIAERGTATRLVRCGVEKTPDQVSGSQAAMEHSAGLSSSQIAATVLAALEGPAA